MASRLLIVRVKLPEGDPKAHVMRVDVTVQRYKGQMQRTGKQYPAEATVLASVPGEERDE